MKYYSRRLGIFSLQAYGLLAFILLGIGCMAHSMNYRTFTKGNIQAGGSLSSSGEAKYYSLKIGTPGNPLRKETHFSLRFSNGKTLKAVDFTTDKIASIATSRKMLVEKSEWGPGAVEYSLEGAVFVFNGERCVSFRSNWIQLPNKVYALKIGNAGADVFYQMPLTQAQLVIIFGEAERVEDRLAL